MSSQPATSRRTGGAPTKATGGLDKVLFIRTSRDLLDALDALVDKEREERPGRTVSRADVARELLYGAVRKKSSSVNEPQGDRYVEDRKPGR